MWLQRYENRYNQKKSYFAILNEHIKRRKKRVQRRQKSIKLYKRGRGLPQVQRAWCKHSFSKNKNSEIEKEKNKNPDLKFEIQLEKREKMKIAFILSLTRYFVLTFVVIHLSGRMLSASLKTALNRKYCIWMVSGVVISGYIRARIYAHEYVNRIILVISYNMDTIYVNRG